MKILIAGCGVAGFSVARKLRELSQDSQVAIVDKEGLGLYTKIRLPEYLAGRLPAAKLTLSGTEAIEKLGIRRISGVAVESLDPSRHIATLEDGSIEQFDKFVIASGADASNPCLSACGSAPIFTLRGMSDADAIIASCTTARTAVVIGGGLLGLEAAWALKCRGLSVEVVECLPRLLPRQLDEEESSVLLRKMSEMGFNFHLGWKLECANLEGGKKVLRFDDGKVLAVDLVLVSAGITPRTAIARSAGIEVGRAIKVGSRLETSAKDVYAVGDCAEIDGRTWGLWAAAKDQGEALGELLAGVRESFSSPVYDPTLKVSGIQMKEIRAEAVALRAGKEAVNGWASLF